MLNFKYFEFQILNTVGDLKCFQLSLFSYSTATAHHFKVWAGNGEGQKLETMTLTPVKKDFCIHVYWEISKPVKVYLITQK